MNSYISPDNKRVIQSVLSVFETGKTEPSYGTVVVLNDGAGITYGKHQSTDGGEDSLDKIVALYIDRGGRYADQLRSFLPRLQANETISANPQALPNWVKSLMDLLERAGEDPVMQAAQDEVFDEHYWAPAAEQATAMALVYPLSWLICYDSTIHSGSKGVSRIRRKFPESPPSNGGEEKAWAVAYLNARRAWLAGHSNSVVRATVYRIDAMLDMVDSGNWDLRTPFNIRRPRATIT